MGYESGEKFMRRITSTLCKTRQKCSRQVIKVMRCLRRARPRSFVGKRQNRELSAADLARAGPAPLIVLFNHIAQPSRVVMAWHSLPAWSCVSLAGVVLRFRIRASPFLRRPRRGRSIGSCALGLRRGGCAVLFYTCPLAPEIGEISGAPC